MKKRIATHIIILLISILSYYIFAYSQNTPRLYNDVYSYHGKSIGFYVGGKGYFVTGHDIVKGLTKAEINRFENVQDKALHYKSFPLEGFSVLKIERELNREVYEIGDSDSVDIGDKIKLPGSSKGKILFKLNHYKKYYFPCFIANFERKKENIGKPVLNFANEVIGLYIKYDNQYLIVPINRIKPYIKEAFQKSEPLSPGAEKAKTENVKSEDIIEEKLSDQYNLTENPKAVRQLLGQPDYQFGEIAEFNFDRNNNLYVLDSYYNELKKISYSGLVEEFSDPLKAVKKEEAVMPESDEMAADKKEKSKKSKAKQIQKDAIKTDAKKDKKTESTKVDPEKLDDGMADKKEADVKKTLPISKKITLKQPVSFAVTESGLIYVLDHGDRKIKIYNELLDLYKELSYDSIARYFTPSKVRAFGNQVFLTSETNKLYVLRQDKASGQMPAVKLNFRKYKWKSMDLEDLAYSMDRFYILDKMSNEILVLSKDLVLIKKFNVKGKFPKSISLFKNELYVFDLENKETFIYDKDGNYLRSWGGPINSFSGNVSLLKVSSTGMVAAAFENFSHIRLYNLDGRLIKILGPFAEGQNDNLSFLSLTMDNDKRLNLVGSDASIYLLPTDDSLSLKKERKFVLKGNLNTAFRGITKGKKGEIFVSDTQTDRLLAYPGIANPFRIAYSGKEFGELGQAVQLASYEGSIYIADKENNRISIISEAGVLQKSFIVRDKNKRLLYPQDIAVGEKGQIFVLAKNKVIQYDINGKVITDFNIKNGKNSYIGYAKGLAFANDIIYVSDTYNDRILRYNLEGELISIIAKAGGSLDSLNHPWDIIADENKLYVIDKGNNRIVEYAYPVIEKEEGMADKEMTDKDKKLDNAMSKAKINEK